MKRYIYNKVYLMVGMLMVCMVMALSSCSQQVNITKLLASAPVIFPDYQGVTIPQQIAPLHFRVEKELGEVVAAKFSTDGGKVVEVSADGNDICISEADWKDLLSSVLRENDSSRKSSSSIHVQVIVKRNGEYCGYKPFSIYVSADSIAPYIAYRLIEPGYEKWYKMGIYQRCLSDYSQSPILENTVTGNNCMNCHNFCNRNAKQMMLHLRAGKLGGTYVMQGDGLAKMLSIDVDSIKSLVYPAWHPSGKLIAFSTNDTHQGFHSSDRNRIEVYDQKSDVVVYDLASNHIFTSPLLNSQRSFETYPCFSPDGKRLYFCTADSVEMPRRYKDVKYSVCSIAFDAAHHAFGTEVDTLFSAHTTGKSAVMPRISPDGKWLVMTVADYGCFPIWHHEADLYIINLRTRQYHPLAAANSRDTESYHSWSSNGRWLLYASRRVNGLYSMPYIVHIDAQGKPSKPFLLPQSSPDYYDKCLKSFNIPEFVAGKVKPCNMLNVSQ